MKLIHTLYLVPLALLAACRGEEPFVPTRECGPIELQAGIVEGGAAVTKAGAEDNHADHLTLTEGTALSLRVSGTWEEHDPENVVQTTTATVGAETPADSKHNSLTFSPVLYWDDFGTADPANATYGRTEGLTIYGAAIDGKTTVPLTLSGTTIDWTLPANQTTDGNLPADKDLLISNNIQGNNQNPYETDCGRYLFTERASGKLLEFTHALSKITVNLKAGAGFSGNFVSAPTVTLCGTWAHTTGTVDVSTGAWSSLDGATEVTMFQNATATTNYNVTKEALVIPGSAFASDASDIVRINADGNIYYVKAKEIRTAINSSTHATDGNYLTEAGKNYIINVTVNKTSIHVTATVTNWTNVNSEVVAPVINVSADFGSAGTAMGDGSFSFYRSLTLNNGYSVNETLIDSQYYPAESVIAKSGETWTMTPQLYWPTHNTHYQFRGVWPRTESDGGPRVEDGTGETDGYQVIKVQNVAYTAGNFPSDLQIARPEIAENVQCSNAEPGHDKKYLYGDGICATEGTINLNFRYMMCQVEVNLTTTEVTELHDDVNLTGAVVEIINVYSTGDVKLGSREVVPTGETGSYTLSNAFSATENETTINITSHPNRRWSAVVPQSLTNVKFKITITNSDSSTDIYYADVAPIKKSGSSDLVAPSGKWESGYHYVYNLKLSKTKVNVSATLANWTPVNASEDVWF